MKFLRLAICSLLFAQFSGCSLVDEFSGGGDELVTGGEQVVIAYAEAPATYSPLTYDAASRKYLLNFYEPLVRYDRSFNFKTGLAVSWGRLDDLTWDFKLREGVIFHDGNEFDANDVAYSLELAMGEDSGLSSLLENIAEVRKTEDLRVEVVTKESDPLLLHKLTNVFMIQDDYKAFESPLGTGPYLLKEFQEWDFVLERFDEYWGPAPFFAEAVLKYVPDPDDRMSLAFDEEIHFLANVPPQYAWDIESYGMQLAEVPSLEVSFLMFNTFSVFGDEDLRKAAWYAISDDYAEELGGGYLKATSQYAAGGIFGTVPDLELREVDFALAGEHREEYRKKYDGAVEVTLDVPWGLDVLGEMIALDLAAVDIDATVNVLEASELEEKILAGESDMYFFGWKYDLADAADFFMSVVHSPDGVYGGFNGIGYDNPLVDDLIEDIAMEFDSAERQGLFKDLVGELAADNVIMPLFESKLLYGIGDSINWDIRLDGQVLASEIVSFVVE